MTTRIYGTSDDLVEIDGDIRGEIDCFGTDDRNYGILLACSDGTILEVKYGKHGQGIWEIIAHTRGELLTNIQSCDNEDDEIYSDQAFFKDGLKWIYTATEWDKIKRPKK